MDKLTFGFIGLGHMGSIIARVVGAYHPCTLLLCDHHPENVRNVTELLAEAPETTIAAATLSDIAAQADCIILGVKPQALPPVLDELAPLVEQRLSRAENDCAATGTQSPAMPLIVTMAAGTRILSIADNLASTCASLRGLPIMRIMPNLPLEYGQGATAFCTQGLSADSAASGVAAASATSAPATCVAADALVRTASAAGATTVVARAAFNAFAAALAKNGMLVEVTEQDMDAVCALSGSGPAFCYLFAGALIAGAQECGLSANAARALAAQTMAGAAAVIENSLLPTDELAERVCSPGGTTIRGVEALRAGKLEDAARAAVLAAWARSKELSK